MQPREISIAALSDPAFKSFVCGLIIASSKKSSSATRANVPLELGRNEDSSILDRNHSDNSPKATHKICTCQSCVRLSPDSK